VNETNFPESALVLVGHGSTQNKYSSQALLMQAEALRRRGLFREVVVGFWKEPPFIAEALGSATSPRVFVLPFFISAGYFSEEAIPEVLGFKTPDSGGVTRVVRHGQQLRIYCRPVGTHEHMTNVILSRAAKVLRDHPFPRVPADRDVTLFIAGHGTERNEESRKSVERQVAIIREQGRFAAVHAVFMEEEPRISDCLKLARTQSVVVVPFFLSDGLHVREDIPVLLGEPERVVRERLAKGRATWRNPTERHGKRLWYAEAVGTDPVLEEVILERVREAALWPDTPPFERP
jgi:sirohydrochlorin cobaltochelatase